MTLGIGIPDALRAVTQAYADTFETAMLAATPATPSSICDDVTVGNKYFQFGFAGQLPKFRRRVGDRHVHRLVNGFAPLTAEPWELTFALKRDDLDAGNTGICQKQVAAAGSRAGVLKDELLADELEQGASTTRTDGTSNLGFDAVALFSTAHTLNPAGNQSNLNTTSALDRTTVDTAYNQMRSFKGNNGQNLNIVPVALVVPAPLEMQAQSLVVPSQTMLTGSNVNALSAGKLSVITLPTLTSDTTWYMMGAIAGITPSTLCTYRAPEFTAMDDPANPLVFMQDEYTYGVQATARVCIPFWPFVIKCTA